VSAPTVLPAAFGARLGGALVGTSDGAEVTASTLPTRFLALTVVALSGATLGRRLPGGRFDVGRVAVSARAPSTVAV
jgi:hypothetical protein